MQPGRLGLVVGAFALLLSTNLAGAPAATAALTQPEAVSNKTGDYISLSAFTADFAKRSVTLKYKIKKALPSSKAKIELVLRNVHASAPQFLQVSDASLRVGSTYTVTYPVSASVPIDRIEASATLLTPLGSGVLQRNAKVSSYALFAPSGTATGKLTLASALTKEISIPVSTFASATLAPAANKQVRLAALVASAYSAGLTQDNLTDTAVKPCALAAGYYLEATTSFTAGKGSATAVDVVVGLKSWTSANKKKKACSDVSVKLNYLS